MVKHWQKYECAKKKKKKKVSRFWAVQKDLGKEKNGF